MSGQLIKLERAIHTELEQKIDAGITKLEKEAKDQAAFYALHNTIPMEHGDLNNYVDGIKGGCLSLISEIDATLQTSSDIKVGGAEMELAKEAEQEKQAEKEQQERKVKGLEADKEAMRSNMPSSSTFKVTLVIVCVALGCAAVDMSAFQSYQGMSAWQAAIMGLLCGGLTAIGAHYTPNAIKLGRTKKARKRIAIGILLLVFIVFFIIGGFRAFEHDGNNIGWGALAFALLNTFFFVVLAAYSHFRGISKADRELLKRWDRINKEIKKETDKLNQIKFEIKAIKRNITTDLSTRLQTMAYSDGLKQKVAAGYQRLVGLLKQEFIKKSTYTPECFSQDIPGLEEDSHYYSSQNSIL